MFIELLVQNHNDGLWRMALTPELELITGKSYDQ
jgi:hypothetical protein